MNRQVPSCMRGLCGGVAVDTGDAFAAAIKQHILIG